MMDIDQFSAKEIYNFTRVSKREETSQSVYNSPIKSSNPTSYGMRRNTVRTTVKSEKEKSLDAFVWLNPNKELFLILKTYGLHMHIIDGGKTLTQKWKYKPSEES